MHFPGRLQQMILRLRRVHQLRSIFTANADPVSDASIYRRNGLLRRSLPMVVAGPWPVRTLVSSGRASRRF